MPEKYKCIVQYTVIDINILKGFFFIKSARTYDSLSH